MNARQMKKRLKKQIYKIQSDNLLMRNIIANNPMMQELYDAYNKPLNVAQLSFQEFKAKRTILTYMAKFGGIIEDTQQLVAQDLFEAVKDNIIYETDNENGVTSITGSIFIGIK